MIDNFLRARKLVVNSGDFLDVIRRGAREETNQRKIQQYLPSWPSIAVQERMLEDLLAETRRVAPANGKERRDVRRASEHWLRHAAGNRVPLLATFDFSSIKGDWGHRFLICTDQNFENAAFVAYGPRFAALLGLPEAVSAIIPLNQQIPERHLPLFVEGCSNALIKQLPARFSGSFEHDFTVELFRAIFLPIRLHPSWSKWLIFGSFNCRTVLSVDRRAQ
jgi:hypothetical protein